MENNTFFAVLKVTTKEGKQMEIDSRPSDAIAIGLRTESPIFVSEGSCSSAIPINTAKKKKRPAISKDFIQTIKPSDFINQSRERDGGIN